MFRLDNLREFKFKSSTESLAAKPRNQKTNVKFNDMHIPYHESYAGEEFYDGNDINGAIFSLK